MSILDINREKKKYSFILAKSNQTAYKTFKKMTNTKPRLSFTESTESMTDKKFSQAKNTYLNTKTKNQLINEKKERHPSYVEFLELRKTVMFPLGNKEKRFKWQDPNFKCNLFFPLRKKIFNKSNICHLKPNLTVSEQNSQKDKLKIGKKKIKRNFSVNGCYFNGCEDFKWTKRVIEPNFNEESPPKQKKKSSSLNNIFYHRTTGNLKSLFDLTPIFIPVKGKKLYKESYLPAKSINIFDENEKPRNIGKNKKKIFPKNKCYYDHLAEEKPFFLKRSNTTVTILRPSNLSEIDLNDLKPINKNNKNKNWKQQRSLGKIKRNKKRSLSQKIFLL